MNLPKPLECLEALFDGRGFPVLEGRPMLIHACQFERLSVHPIVVHPAIVALDAVTGAARALILSGPPMAVDEEVALERFIEDADASIERSFWRSFGGAMRRAAIATGSGTAWLARTGYDNRNYVPAVLNGAIGDKLARAGDSLAIEMSFRHERRDVPVEALAVPMAAGSGHAAVFVHGLMGDEVMWQHGFGDNAGPAAMLERERGIVPLCVRYNSGLHISHNGRALADLLESLVHAHTGDLESLALVGHSMGALVVRSAEHYGRAQGHHWPERVGSIALLGAPNDGSYLEQVSHLTSFILKAIPNFPTRVIARVIDERSDGIKDLRIGLLVEDDWRRPDAEHLRLDQRTRVPLLPDTRYHVVVGTLTQDEESIIATYLGDGLVGKRSALGRDHAERHHSVEYRVFTQTGHVGLLTSPDVQRYLCERL